MKILHRLAIFCLAAGCATSAAAASDPALYSFSELYRLTVNGAVPEVSGLAALGSVAPQVRGAGVPPGGAPAEGKFPIPPIPGPRPWMLLLAGLAAAAWVAHRRLTRPL